MSGHGRPRLAASRRALGLSPTDAAERAGVTLSAWCKWESGARSPNQQSRLRIAAVLGMPEDPDVVEADMAWLLEVV